MQMREDKHCGFCVREPVVEPKQPLITVGTDLPCRNNRRDIRGILQWIRFLQVLLCTLRCACAQFCLYFIAEEIRIPQADDIIKKNWKV